MFDTKTKFKVFFKRVDTKDHEAAMNALLEDVDKWLLETGKRTVLSWKWRHMADRSNDPSPVYVEVEIIYSERAAFA